MDNEITDLLNQAGINLTFSMYLDKPAHYIPRIKSVLVNTRLNEQEQKNAILHELGHVLGQKGFEDLYWNSYSMHAKMEADAEEFKIKHLLKDYLNNPDNDIDQFNSCHFVEEEKLDFRFEPFIRNWYRQYKNLGYFF